MTASARPKRLISIVVPLYNEVLNVGPLHEEICVYTKKLPYNFEIIFVDDGSRDNSAIVVSKIAGKDKRVHLLRFSRNFGKEAATTAGLRAAKGDAAIIMDADLQHPPKLIGKFLKEWEAGKEVVVGVKKYGKDVSWLKRKSSSFFYKILNSIAHTGITPHACDYRLIDRVVLDEFNKLTERNRMIRGLIDWLGFDRGYVYFVAPPRLNGEATYSYRKLIELAFNSFTAYSMMPLKLAGYMGVFTLLVSAPLGVFVIIERYILDDPLNLRITGTASLAIALLFLVGVVLASLGLVALYIARIYAEVVDRPLYVLRPDSGTAQTEEHSEEI
ncbi:MAG TPA: glycosyltransferase family 2 protein [Patescibacteria group bacterium]|nr:glycosyltransferase family 2 protein [Patescibacteria group bacterium]